MEQIRFSCGFNDNNEHSFFNEGRKGARRINTFNPEMLICWLDHLRYNSVSMFSISVDWYNISKKGLYFKNEVKLLIRRRGFLRIKQRHNFNINFWIFRRHNLCFLRRRCKHAIWTWVSDDRNQSINLLCYCNVLVNVFDIYGNFIKNCAEVTLTWLRNIYCYNDSYRNFSRTILLVIHFKNMGKGKLSGYYIFILYCIGNYIYDCR